jgi:hypothetical protein
MGGWGAARAPVLVETNNFGAQRMARTATQILLDCRRKRQNRESRRARERHAAVLQRRPIAPRVAHFSNRIQADRRSGSVGEFGHELRLTSRSVNTPAPPLGDRPPGEGERHQGEYRDDPS